MVASGFGRGCTLWIFLDATVALFGGTILVKAVVCGGATHGKKMLKGDERARKML